MFKSTDYMELAFKTFLFQASFPDIITDPRLIIPHLQWILK